MPLGYISQETFPLPTLHPLLLSVSQERHLGHGFKELHDLLVWRHGRSKDIIIIAGISSHITPVGGRQGKHCEGRPADVVLNHIED